MTSLLVHFFLVELIKTEGVVIVHTASSGQDVN